jgi:hypothetical protein
MFYSRGLILKKLIYFIIPEEIVLNPERFGENPYSKKEKMSSDVPRVFFYLDVKQREPMFEKNYSLYKATVPSVDIYDLEQDPDSIKEKFRSKYSGIVDSDAVLKYISGWSKKSGKWTRGPALYKGVYYNVGFDVVIWFEPIVVTIVPESFRMSLESEKTNDVEKDL